MKTNKTKMIKYLVLLLMITPLVTFSQSIFEKYEDLDDVTTVVVTKSAFKLMARIGGDSKQAKEYIDDVKNLENLAVYTTSDTKIAAQMKADVNGYLKTSNLSELFRVKDKDGNVKIYVKEGKDDQHIKELFMFVDNIKNVNIKGESPKVVLLSLTGDIDLEKIGRVFDSMNVPGGKHIKKATSKK